MIQKINRLSEINSTGQYIKASLPEDCQQILTIELETDFDTDQEYFIVHVGNYTIMSGWNPKRWKTIRRMKEALIDYAVRGEHNLGYWSYGRFN